MAEPSENQATEPNTTETSPEAGSSSPSSSQQQQQQPKTCAQCSKNPESLKDCNKCHSTFYCNKDCQKANYKTHKKVCASLAQEYVKLHEPKMAGRAPPRSGDRNTGYKKWQFDT